MSTPKIAKYSLSDLKNTTDDALPNYLNSLKFKQKHSLTDVRLALGYTAVTLAGALFYFDWKFGWDASKPYTLPAVIVYFILNSALTIWIWGVEKGIVYTGEKDGKTISISSSVQKYTPIYNVTVRATAAATPITISSSFTRWFDQDGCFVAKPFQQWLATEVPMIGSADPKNKQARIEGVNGNVQVAEAVLIQNETPRKARAEMDGEREGTPSTGTRSRKGKR